MVLPKSVYESIPVIYVVIGIAAVTAVDSFMSFISGILLSCSGIVIMYLRRNYRNSQSAFEKVKIS